MQYLRLRRFGAKPVIVKSITAAIQAVEASTRALEAFAKSLTIRRRLGTGHSLPVRLLGRSKRHVWSWP